MFGSGNYYSRSEYEEKSPIGKLAGFGMWAGIAVIGGNTALKSGVFTNVLRAAYSSSTLGNLGTMARKGSNALRGGGIGGAVDELLSSEALAYSDGLRDFTEGAISETIGHRRADEFIQNIAQHVDEGSQEAFQGIASQLRSRVLKPLQNTKMEDARQVLMGSHFLDDFNKLTKGIAFNMDSRTELQKTIGRAAETAYDEQVRRKLVMDIMSSDKNKEIATKLIKKGADQRRKTYNLFNKLTPSDYKEITIGDLFDDKGEVSALGKKLDAEVQRLAGLNKESSFVKEVKRRFDESLGEAFGGPDKSITHLTGHAKTLTEEFKKDFMQAKTGFVIGDGGDLISKSYLGKQLAKKGQNLLNDFSLPLLPGAFKVNMGKMFSFMKEDNRFVRNLGRAIAQPEIMRKTKGNISEASSFLSIGRHVVDLNTETLEMSEVQGTYRMLSKRLSNQTAQMASVRSQAAENFQERAFRIMSESGALKKIKAGLAPDEGDMSLLKRQLYDKQHLFLEPFVDGKIGVKPTNYGMKMGVDAAVIRKLFPDATNIDLTDLNHHNLTKLQDQFAVLNSPGLGTEVAMLLGQQAATKPTNIGGFLKEASEKLKPADLRIGNVDVVPDFVLDLARKADDPVALLEAMQQANLFDPDVRRGLTQYPKLFEAIEQARVDKSAFYDTAANEGNMFKKLGEGLGGETNLRKPVLDMQEALLEQIQAAHGVIRMKEAGVNEAVIGELTGMLSSPSTDQLNNPLARAMAQTLGLDPHSQSMITFTRNTVRDIYDKDDQIQGHVLGRIASFLGDDSALKKLKTYDNNIGSKITYSRMNHLNVLQQGRLSSLPMGVTEPELDRVYQSLYEKIHDLSKSDEISKNLVKRFKDRNFEPYKSDLTHASASDYYLVSQENTFTDFLADPFKTISSIFSTDANTGVFDKVKAGVMGYVDPNSAHSVGTYFNTVLGQMSNNLAIEAGLGVSLQDKMTVGRTFAAYALKRVAPLVLGLELYKNANADANTLGIMGIDDIGANAFANTNLAFAGLKDRFGLTDINKMIVESIPGLDQYFSPRSKDEYEEYLLYGNEGVRNGRGWLIGNRNNITGGQIDYFRPNFYRRWKSGWTSADNVDLANPNYSWLPTITNPFAPINRLVNPNWWEEKHKYDRPYKENGLGNTGVGSKFHVMAAAYNFDPDEQEEGIYFQGAGSAGYGFGGGGGGAGGPGMPTLSLGGGANPFNALGSLIDRYRDQSGLYGAMFKLMPFLPNSPEMPIQQSKDAIGFRRFLFENNYGELLGPGGEFLRRIIGMPNDYTHAYSPYKNDMPSWLPNHFRSGDPYRRVKGTGELQLPGEAFELTHQWIRPMKVRGSMIGMTEDEIIQKWLDPVQFESSDYTEYGSYAHHEAQKQLEEAGLLLSAEVPIVDEINNLSGTIDAVVSGPNGPTVVEIKTQNEEDFLAGKNPEKYIEQLNFYLHTTQTDVGYLAYINSSDPSQVRFVEHHYDEERFQQTMDKIERARDRVRTMILGHQISPYETYDILGRLEVLGRVAPESQEYKELVEYAEQGGFNANEQMIFNRIKADAHEKAKQYRTYAYRDVDTKTLVGKVLSINPDGSITTDKGSIRLAGVEMDPQAFSHETPEEVFSRFGIEVGGGITYQVNASLNRNILSDTTVAAKISSVNQRIVEQGYANYMSKPEDPMDFKTKNNPGLFRNTIEWIMHRDNIIANKFLRVRSALEQFERGEVYGTDFATWREPFDTFLKPTITSMVAKDPITAGLQSALIASFFFRKRTSMIKAGSIAGGLAALTSGLIKVRDMVSKDPWTPKNYRKQNKIDEYYDALEFVKQTAISERARQDAYLYEGVNLDLDTETKSAYRNIMEKAEERAQQTMFAFDEAKGTLEQALEAIPYRHQQIAKEIILYGSQKEKNRYYDLLPDAQRRVLGKFLGKFPSDLPKKKNLRQMFSKHTLPDGNWEGWSPDANLDDYSAATSEVQDTNVVGISRAQRARLAEGGRVRIPRMDNPQLVDIRRRLNSLASEINMPINIDVKAFPSNKMEGSVNFNISHDKSAQIDDNTRRDIQRG